MNPYVGFSGANGNKLSIRYKDEEYMLKLPAHAKHNKNMHYSNSSISEYVGCHIYQMLGIPAQETLLGTYQGKISVACKDLNQNGYELFEFGKIKNTLIDTPGSGYGTNLSDVLKGIQEQKLVDQTELTEFFWNMFVVDALIGNFDRHNGNWGLLTNKKERLAKIAPVYDCGSCLFPQNREEDMINILNDVTEMYDRSFVRPRSALMIDGKKINYFDFLSHTNNEDCQKALFDITNRIDLSKIKQMIDEIDGISNIHKKFLYQLISDRKSNILDQAMNIQLDNQIVHNYHSTLCYNDDEWER